MKKKEVPSSPSGLGEVFTPPVWAHFAIEKFGLFDKWMDGATVFDPTMGEGNLLESLIDYGLVQGISVADLPIENLYGVELQSDYVENFLRKGKQKYGKKLRYRNFFADDIFFLHEEKPFDLIFSNPPWKNFADLPEEYKEKVKPLFYDYDLVGDPQKLLLGGSRIDIAALVISKTLKKNLKEDGEAVFFIPLSLFQNDGANNALRSYKVGDIDFCIEEIHDLKGVDAFKGVATRYGSAHVIRDKKQVFPIRYYRNEGCEWVEYNARPLFAADGPLSIIPKGDEPLFESITPLLVKKYSKPRQGVNTCGANNCLLFYDYEKIDDRRCKVTLRDGSVHLLPADFIYPLVSSSNFREEELTPGRWILLPYTQDGRVLYPEEVEKDKDIYSFLSKFQTVLKERKGAYIGATIKRGCWWVLLGVGKYSFSQYKVFWEASGKKRFLPKIFPGRWQGNQALHGYMPANTLEEAQRIKEGLSRPIIEKYLLSLRMEGTLNWAQPGKIKKIITYDET